MPEPVECELIKTFHWNHTYRVADGEGRKYYLKVNPHASVDRTERMVRLISHLKQNGINVPVPISGKDKRGFTEVLCNNRKLCSVLYPHIDGEQFEHKNIPMEKAAQIGRITAKMHRCLDLLPDGFIPEHFNEYWLFDRVDNVIGRHLGRESPCAAALGNTIQNIKKKYASFSAAKPQYGLIHQDIHLSNFIFTPQGMAIIDFETFANGPRLLDITVYSYDSLHHWDRGELQAGKIRLAAFLEGYESIRKLAPCERGLLAIFPIIRILLAYSRHLNVHGIKDVADAVGCTAEGITDLIEKYISASGCMQ